MTTPARGAAPDGALTLAALIPAYNEAGRLAGVLDVLRGVEALEQIIVVDDGSSDATASDAQTAAARDGRVVCLSLPANQGKAKAVLAGARATTAGWLILLDADLTGLRREHVDALWQPVRLDQADMAVGVFRNGRWNTDLSHWLTPWLSGQRCLSTERLLQVAEQDVPGYGLETALTLTARRRRWRRRHVTMAGVAHPPSEYHRGGPLAGGWHRLKMYGQIVATAWTCGVKPWLAPARRWVRRLTSLAVLLVILGSFMYDRSLASASISSVNNLPVVDVAAAHRLLVIAPHPDDEIIGAGGILQVALAAGLDVRVVVVTNGDGQRLAPLAVRGQVRAHHQDYVAMGVTRQAETLAAMAELGVPRDDVSFLGYPDGGLQTLWRADWARDCPLRSRYTGSSASPYQLSFNPAARYCGQDVLQDLKTLLTEFHPDLIVIPHPEDQHPDHAATSVFARLALAELEQADPSYQPDLWGYLVHYGDFPQPRGLRATRLLAPPRPLAGDDWWRVTLTAHQVQAKAQALNAYSTQERLLGSFLPSFARPDELFVRLTATQSPLLLLDNSGLIGPAAWYAWPEPARESMRRLLLDGADLVELRVGQLGDHAWLAARARGPLSRDFQYYLLVKTPDGRTTQLRLYDTATRLGRTSYVAELDLAAMHHPSLLSVAAEVRRGFTLDRTAWHVVTLTQSSPGETQ